MIRYSIVVPTLNERENILLLIGRIEKSGLENYEIIVADENSPTARPRRSTPTRRKAIRMSAPS